ncbi:MAG TPA: type I restriction-modification system subunit M, partial [Dialister sp.]|nr:type I restriction-modification system subunit M [Dialister sp.]
SWKDMKSYKDGTYGKPAVQKRLKILRMEAPMEEGTTEAMVIGVLKMAEEEKALKKEIKSAEDSLTDRTKNRIEKLSPEEEEILLKAKWIQPLMHALEGLSDKVVVNLEKEVQQMADKYKDTYRDIDEEIRKAETSLASMMGELTGPEKDMEGLRQLAELLGGKV